MSKKFRKPKKVTLNLSEFWYEGLTTKELAEDLMMNPKAVTALKKGTEKGDWVTLITLSRYFNVPIETLLEIED